MSRGASEAMVDGSLAEDAIAETLTRGVAVEGLPLDEPFVSGCEMPVVGNWSTEVVAALEEGHVGNTSSVEVGDVLLEGVVPCDSSVNGGDAAAASPGCLVFECDANVI